MGFPLDPCNDDEIQAIKGDNTSKSGTTKSYGWKYVIHSIGDWIWGIGCFLYVMGER